MHELVAAGAAFNNLPTSDYTGLAPGTAYSGYVGAPRTYWAAAALAPKPSSIPAMVAGQDAGSYLLFWRQAGAPWHVVLDGSGISTKTTCQVPPTLVRLWGWPSGARAPAHQ